MDNPAMMPKTEEIKDVMIINAVFKQPQAYRTATTATITAMNLNFFIFPSGFSNSWKQIGQSMNKY